MTGLFRVRELSEATSQTAEMVEAAREEHRPSKIYLLFSGGDDSLVLLDRCAEYVDAVVHVNTGFGIVETTEFVRQVVADRGLPLLELHPPISYEECVLTIWNGFPGPGQHRFTYDRLKGRAVENLLRSVQTRRGERFLLLTGLRRSESQRRKSGRYDPINRKGREVWVNPLFHWSAEEMREYRHAHNLPRNPVSVELHKSGECLCGSMASPGEREELLLFRPSFVRDRIEPLEAKCRELGKRYCQWGTKLVAEKEADPAQLAFMPMCVGCEARQLPEEGE